MLVSHTPDLDSWWNTIKNGVALAGGQMGVEVGAALGALIFGVVQQGLFFTNVEGSLFRVFLGVILLRAVTGER